MSEVIANSYFCGAGLMDSGLIEAGVTIGQSFELDTAACKTYRQNIGDHVVNVDISEKLVLDDKDCHAQIFTYPCNKYSTIGDIHGVRTGDDLFLHSLRHLAISSPEMYAVENVPGMRAFPLVVEAMTKIKPYHVQVFCPVNSNIWLPQTESGL